MNECPYGCGSTSLWGHVGVWTCGSYRLVIGEGQSAACLQLCQERHIRELQAEVSKLTERLRAIPAGYERHVRGDGRRFHAREFNREYQVYGCGLLHIAICPTREIADMVADALETAAELQETTK